MGLINRTDDASQQQEILVISNLQAGTGGSALIPTGSTLYGNMIVPRAMQIQSVQMTCFGISGAPQILLGALRFGASFGSFIIGTTGLLPAYGVSGYLGYSIGAAGGTVLNLLKGDVLWAQQLGGSAAATTGTVINVVVKNLQDVKSWY